MLDFKSDFAERFLEGPSTKFLEKILIRLKTWPPGGVAFSLICIYREL
jgi:hypothetical protein